MYVPPPLYPPLHCSGEVQSLHESQIVDGVCTDATANQLSWSVTQIEAPVPVDAPVNDIDVVPEGFGGILIVAIGYADGSVVVALFEAILNDPRTAFQRLPSEDAPNSVKVLLLLKVSVNLFLMEELMDKNFILCC